MRLREVVNNNFRCCGYHNVKAEHKRAEVGYEIGQKY